MRLDSARPLLLLAVLFASMLPVACSDGPTGPPPASSPWVEVSLPDTLPSSGLTSIAFKGSRGLALGSTGASGAKPDYVLESNGADWSVQSLPVNTDDFLLAVAIDGAGKGVIVGVNISSAGSPLVLAERPGWTRVALPATNGGLQAVTVDESGTFLAAGPGGASIFALSGTADGSWTTVSIPLPGDPQEKSLVDLAWHSGTWAGCGFDDGANGDEDSPFSVLLTDEGAGWILRKGLGCGGCGNREFRAVAFNQQGALLLGGAITDFSAGAVDDYVAFLMQYDAVHDEWLEFVLPEAGTLDRVNDILVAANGDVYLACGESGSALVHHYSTGETTIEWQSSDVRLQSLAEAENGDIYAVGLTAPQNSFTPTPYMLRRPADG